MASGRFITPFVLPVAAFAATILAGALALSLDAVAKGAGVSFVDALFMSTSSVCVTGLATVDPGTVFNRGGQGVLVLLMQLGGLGIVTYSTLILYMFSRRISLFDRLAVGQALLHDSRFHLGRFLKRAVIMILCLEFAGAVLLYAMEPESIGPFNAVFIAVSGFCNAGLAPWSDNLMQWQDHWGVNLVMMALIITGGIGFFVLDEVWRLLQKRFRGGAAGRVRICADDPLLPKPGLSYYSRIVLKTSFLLVFGGALCILLADLYNPVWKGVALPERILRSLFQSVTSRTAGFASVDMNMFTDFALLCTVILMFIGASPGSCGGGIKTTTFRVLLGYFSATLRGRSQVLVAGRGVDAQTLNKAILLFYFSLLTVAAGLLLLTLTENGAAPHGEAHFRTLDLLFEAVSAFATVGLSVNVSPRLSEAGKIIVCLLMFIGRLGPIWLITTLQQFQNELTYRYPEGELPIG